MFTCPFAQLLLSQSISVFCFIWGLAAEASRSPGTPSCSSGSTPRRSQANLRTRPLQRSLGLLVGLVPPPGWLLLMWRSSRPTPSWTWVSPLLILPLRIHSSSTASALLDLVLAVIRQSSWVIALMCFYAGWRSLALLFAVCLSFAASR